MSLLPSSYFGGMSSLEKAAWREPHKGCTRLLQVPSAERIGSQGLQFTFATGHWTLNAAMEKLCTILYKSIIGLLIATAAYGFPRQTFMSMVILVWTHLPSLFSLENDHFTFFDTKHPTPFLGSCSFCNGQRLWICIAKLFPNLGRIAW